MATIKETREKKLAEFIPGPTALVQPTPTEAATQNMQNYGLTATEPAAATTPQGPIYSTGTTEGSQKVKPTVATKSAAGASQVSGAGGITGGEPTAKTTYSYTQYQGSAPVYTPLSPYVPVAQPTPMEKAAKTQEYAGLGLREARRNLRETVANMGISGKSANPAQAQVLRNALQAHGVNIESTVRGARATAESELAAETSRKESAAQFGYAAKQQENINKFQSLWNKYTSSGVQTTTTTTGTGFTSNAKTSASSPYTQTLQNILASKKTENPNKVTGV